MSTVVICGGRKLLHGFASLLWFGLADVGETLFCPNLKQSPHVFWHQSALRHGIIRIVDPRQQRAFLDMFTNVVVARQHEITIGIVSSVAGGTKVLDDWLNVAGVRDCVRDGCVARLTRRRFSENSGGCQYDRNNWRGVVQDDHVGVNGSFVCHS